VILSTLYFVSAETPRSWCTMKGDLQRAFPLGVPMVLSPKLLRCTWQQPDRCWPCSGQNHLLLSPESFSQWGYSGAVFVGTVHSGSPSLHTTHKDSSDEGDPTSGKGGSSGSPGPRGCNVVTPTFLIITTPVPVWTPTVLVWFRCTTARYGAPPRLAAGLLVGAASADPCSVD
jgi:hypothetical protein